MKNGNIIAVGKRKGQLFVIKFKVRRALGKYGTSLFFWHKRIAHQNVKEILRFQNISFKDQKFCCENCIIGKIHRLSFPKSDTKI